MPPTGEIAVRPVIAMLEQDRDKRRTICPGRAPIPIDVAVARDVVVIVEIVVLVQNADERVRVIQMQWQIRWQGRRQSCRPSPQRSAGPGQ